ncbi:WD repeat-containing protein on Y chromosome-like [Cheilinus undulatus]|uniref:WD repeat-containing protein on Y chromosome-like n=1 Tax=Cheilinus undulatus TaxID=241271 RepID=UPI001BD3FA9F|nr:WD repeat-containing protein on Y chromosome-like [Cheilinus undulatus]
MSYSGFTEDDIPLTIRKFNEADADGSGALHLKEFRDVMKTFLNVPDEDLEALHMKIDANCDSTVNLEELIDFLLLQDEASSDLEKPFPKGFDLTATDERSKIVKTVFQPYAKNLDTRFRSSEVRPYEEGQYTTISRDGTINIWRDGFKKKKTMCYAKDESLILYMHKKRMYVNDMVFIPELDQMAVCTNSRELFFYSFSAGKVEIESCLILDDITVRCMNYATNDTERILSLGDDKGNVYFLMSSNIKSSLFSLNSEEKVNLNEYPTADLLYLLKNRKKGFWCCKKNVFDGICRQIKYFPALDSFAITDVSCTKMVLLSAPKQGSLGQTTFTYKSQKEVFTCVEYCHSNLITGGRDGTLRLWYPGKTKCHEVLEGHVKPIIDVLYSEKDDMLLSLSEDKNVRVWKGPPWKCVQSFEVQGLSSTISSVCYNTINNELVVASSDIAKSLGRGTDVFLRSLKSHNSPLCCALYHSIFKQVVSVCQNGQVIVWDFKTGDPVVQFAVNTDKQIGLTAMSFDQSKRRLLTVSQDGKVRLWNFNSGCKLLELPVCLPKTVTGIIFKDDRVFIAGLNCRTIFNLDLEGDDHRFMRHPFLEDVCSMDLHEDMLVTASSSGKIIVWRLGSTEDVEAALWINASESPWVHVMHESLPGKTGSLLTGISALTPNPKRQPKVTHVNDKSVICLKNRENKEDTAALLTCAGGYIYAWSLNIKGGLVGKFRATEDESATVTTMTLDSEERILLTGDSKGMIYQWDIDGFWSTGKSLKGPFEETYGRRVSLCPPPLLQSWKAHLTEVVSVMSDEKFEHIITAGLDCCIRRWTRTGCFKGVFGRDKWDLMSSCRQEYYDHELLESQNKGERESEDHLCEERSEESSITDEPVDSETLDEEMIREGTEIHSRTDKLRVRRLNNDDEDEDTVKSPNVGDKIQEHPPQALLNKHGQRRIKYTDHTSDKGKHNPKIQHEDQDAQRCPADPLRSPTGLQLQQRFQRSKNLLIHGAKKVCKNSQCTYYRKLQQRFQRSKNLLIHGAKKPVHLPPIAPTEVSEIKEPPHPWSQKGVQKQPVHLPPIAPTEVSEIEEPPHPWSPHCSCSKCASYLMKNGVIGFTEKKKCSSSDLGQQQQKGSQGQQLHHLRNVRPQGRHQLI